MEKRRLPSPGLIIAVIALVLALGGSALAAKRYLITNAKQISPAALKQIAKLAAGTPGPAGANGTPGSSGANGSNGERGAPGPGAVVYWAVVSKEGEVKRHGTGTVTAEKQAVGTYAVQFDADVTNCAYEAAIGGFGTSGSEDPGFATVNALAAHANGVFVQTYPTTAQKVEDRVDKNFHLAVYC